MPDNFSTFDPNLQLSMMRLDRANPGSKFSVVCFTLLAQLIYVLFIAKK
jgi:hypothetical protein